MKKIIRVKVKTLLLFALLSFAILSSRTLYWQAIYLYNTIAPDAMNIKTSAINTHTLKNENNRLKKLIFENDYAIYNLITINPGSHGLSSSIVSEKDAQKVLETFLKHNEKLNAFENHPEYAMNVALIQWFSGNVNSANALLNQTQPQKAQEADWLLLQTGFALGVHDFNALDDHLKALKNTNHEALANQIDQYTSYLQGHLDTFEPNQMIQFKSYAKLFGTINTAAQYISDFPQYQTNASIPIHKPFEGVVTVDSKPVKGAIVFASNYKGFSNLMGFYLPHQITDASGYYRFETLYEDTKSMGILIPWHLVKEKQFANHYDFEPFVHNQSERNFEFEDKVTFETISVQDETLLFSIADPLINEHRTYSITVTHVNPNYSFYSQSWLPLDRGITSGKIPLDLFRANTNNAISSHLEEDPSYLPPLYLSGDYRFEIRVTDDTLPDDYYVSNGFFSDSPENQCFVLGLDKMSQGDELFFDKKYEAAITAYALEDSIHAKQMRIALYEKYDEWDQALKLIDELIDLTPNTTSWHVKKSSLLSDIGHRQAAIGALHKAIAIAPDQKHLYTWVFKEELLDGQIDAAVATYKRHLYGTREGFYYNHFLILIGASDLIDSSIKDLVDAIIWPASYQPLLLTLAEGNFEQGLSLLNEMPDDDYKTFTSLLLEDALGKSTVSNFVDHYREQTEQVTDANLKDILKTLKRFHNWFY